MPPKRAQLQPSSSSAGGGRRLNSRQPTSYLASFYNELTARENRELVISVTMFGVRKNIPSLQVFVG